MKIIITKKDDIKSKSGQEYVKLSALSISGEAFDIFTSKEQYLKFSFDETKIVSSSDIEKIVDSFDPCEVQYNKQGRVESLN